MGDLKKWIGIDGGGTGTQCVIGDQDGKLLAVSDGSSSNIQSKSLPEVKEVLTGLINDVLVNTQTNLEQVDTVYLALAGGDRPADKRRISQALQGFARQNVELIIESDAMGALSAGTGGNPGLVLIAGTGSIVYACPSAKKELIRVGGWGYLLGDEGSGYDIGRKGLAAVLKQFDGRGSETQLTELIMDELRVSDPSVIVTEVYGKDDVRSGIAGLSRVVFQAAKQGDLIARGIVEGAIEQLILLVDTAKKRTTQQSESLPIVVSGGLFQDDLFRNKFEKEIHRHFHDLSLIYPFLPPVAGAYMLALKHSGQTITGPLKKTIENSLAHLMQEGVDARGKS